MSEPAERHDAAATPQAASTPGAPASLARVRALLEAGDVAAAERVARAALDDMEPQPTPARAALLRAHARALAALGRGDEARQRLIVAAAIHHGRDEPLEEGQTLLEHGLLERELNAPKAARDLLRRARALLRAADDPRSLARALVYLADLACHSTPEERAETRAWLLAALPTFEASADLASAARCYNALAELARADGDLGAAARAYQRAMTLIDRDDPAQRALSGAVVRLNIGLVWLARAQHELALSFFEQALSRFAACGRADFIGHTHALCLACLADERADAPWRRHVAAFKQALEGPTVGHPDTCRALEAAAERATTTARAHALLIFARTMWRRLDDAEAVERVERRLIDLHAA